MKYRFAVCALFLFAVPVQAQTLEERIRQLEDLNAKTAQDLATIKADVAAIKADVFSMKNQATAVLPTVPQYATAVRKAAEMGCELRVGVGMDAGSGDFMTCRDDTLQTGIAGPHVVVSRVVGGKMMWVDTVYPAGSGQVYYSQPMYYSPPMFGGGFRGGFGGGGCRGGSCR